MALFRRLRNQSAWGASLLALWIIFVAASPTEKSDPLCPHIIACKYEAPAFSIRVVDDQTGQPLADVHAIATWVVYGGPSRRSLLMVLEAVSDPDGRLAFSAWGPVWSGLEGVLPGRDPMISLFRPGYRTNMIYNATPVDRSDTARIRSFDDNAATFHLIPFKGTAAETIAELRKAEDPFEGARAIQPAPKGISQALIERLRRVRDAVERLPRDEPQVQHFHKLVNDDIRYLEGGGQP